ncbi:MAG: acyl carrier protein [Herminiimonas sp.]|nr:acyl carrier protein [Herminiimonas sp.]
MRSIEDVKMILADALSLGERAKRLNSDSALLGSLPELDSMGVINIIAALEEHFDIMVNDEEITADTFATLGSLTTFVDQKLAE